MQADPSPRLTNPYFAFTGVGWQIVGALVKVGEGQRKCLDGGHYYPCTSSRFPLSFRNPPLRRRKFLDHRFDRTKQWVYWPQSANRNRGKRTEYV